ncbi:unnamed protein product [Rhizoctonia solani]|nr:unnamed protein product [Rhizoctonia solani]
MHKIIKAHYCAVQAAISLGRIAIYARCISGGANLRLAAIRSKSSGMLLARSNCFYLFRIELRNEGDQWTVCRRYDVTTCVLLLHDANVHVLICVVQQNTRVCPPQSKLPLWEVSEARIATARYHHPTTTAYPVHHIASLNPELIMSADPPGSPTNHERFRRWITDVEVNPENNDPNCKFSARMFVDHNLVCDLPVIDSTGSLRWSGLLHRDVSPNSTVSLRLCMSIRGRPRYFNYPNFVISEVDEETGEMTLGTMIEPRRLHFTP